VTVTVSSSEALGQFLVGQDGLTLYSFTPDPINESVCYDKCATAWPPLVVASIDALKVEGVIPGKFGTTTRKDGTLQVTYNGVPLYYWFKDKQAGDTTGHRVGRVWWVVPPATVYTQAVPELGTILVGPTGLSLYVFTKDTPDTSTCYDKCAENWPPLTIEKADAFVPGINVPGKFGTTTRKDGAIQVTYNGLPLYYWNGDKAVGETKGEGVGKVWFTISPETVSVSKLADVGEVLVTFDGMTLYTFANDKPDTSTCADDCAKAWPPYVLFGKDRLVTGIGVTGKLGTITRADKSVQVTYNGAPLYLFAKDTAPGQATGDKVGNVWAVVKP
jgi:predicted lipoprotein with Yx(FWY)xxD motif